MQVELAVGPGSLATPKSVSDYLSSQHLTRPVGHHIQFGEEGAEGRDEQRPQDEPKA
jgi:hypothetical protein